MFTSFYISTFPSNVNWFLLNLPLILMPFPHSASKFLFPHTKHTHVLSGKTASTQIHLTDNICTILLIIQKQDLCVCVSFFHISLQYSIWYNVNFFYIPQNTLPLFLLVFIYLLCKDTLWLYRKIQKLF